MAGSGGPGFERKAWGLVTLMLALGYAARGLVLWVVPLLPLIITGAVFVVLWVVFVRRRW